MPYNAYDITNKLKLCNMHGYLTTVCFTSILYLGLYRITNESAVLSRPTVIR